jgi:macrolide phosphotransferase
VERSPLFLAALASAAVPGLDPTSVEALPSGSGQLFDVAFVQDSEHRRWVVRAPRTEAAGAQMDTTVALLGLLARRLPFSLPTPRGFTGLKGGGRAAVYPYLPGQAVDFAALPAGPGLAADLGRAIAAVHNIDHGLFEEAGLPAYDADTCRTRRLSELDRAAATGQVPTGLLSRWERLLEDVAIWRFAPTPTHGDLTGDQVLVIFDDDRDVATGRVTGITGWDDARVADPADDLASLVAHAPAKALDTLVEAYAHARRERPDPALLTRARLVAEMGEVAELMRAIAAGERALAEQQAQVLRELDDRLGAADASTPAEEPDDYQRTGLRPARIWPRAVPPPEILDDDADPPEPEQSAVDSERPERPAPEAQASEQAAPGVAPPEATPEVATSETGVSAVEVPEPEVAEAARAHEPSGGQESPRPEPPRRPAPDGPDPGPEFEPGYQPT